HRTGDARRWRHVGAPDKGRSRDEGVGVMSSLLGVLPLGRSVVVPGYGSHVLTPGDLEVWGEGAAGTPVHSSCAPGRRSLAGHVDRVRIDKSRVFVWGDLDPALPGGAEARWGITKSGVFD